MRSYSTQPPPHQLASDTAHFRLKPNFDGHGMLLLLLFGNAEPYRNLQKWKGGGKGERWLAKAAASMLYRQLREGSCQRTFEDWPSHQKP